MATSAKVTKSKTSKKQTKIVKGKKTKAEIAVIEYTDEELLSMPLEEVTKDMTPIQTAYCEYYVQDYNTFTSYVKAVQKVKGMTNKNRTHATNFSAAYSMRLIPKVRRYIAWLKVRISQAAAVNAVDVLNAYAKLAFYDISDYLDYNPDYGLKLKDIELIDGQVVQEITQTADGKINVKFPDRLKALTKLEDYMQDSTYNWKRKLEERKLDLMQERIELEKAKSGMIDSMEDDGFLAALQAAAKNINISQPTEEEV